MRLEILNMRICRILAGIISSSVDSKFKFSFSITFVSWQFVQIEQSGVAYSSQKAN